MTFPHEAGLPCCLPASGVTPAFLRSSLMSSSMYFFSSRLRCAAGPGAGVGVLTRLGVGVGVVCWRGRVDSHGCGVFSGLLVGVLVGAGAALAAPPSGSGMTLTSMFCLTHWRSARSTRSRPTVTAPL